MYCPAVVSPVYQWSHVDFRRNIVY